MVNTTWFSYTKEVKMENEKQEINPIEYLNGLCEPKIKETPWDYLGNKVVPKLEGIMSVKSEKNKLELIDLLLGDMDFNLNHWFIDQFKNISFILAYPYEDYEMVVYIYVLKKLREAKDARTPFVVKQIYTRLNNALRIHKETIDNPDGLIETSILNRWYYFFKQKYELPCDLTRDVKKFLTDVMLNLDWIKWIAESYGATEGNTELYKMIIFVKQRLPMRLEFLGDGDKGAEKSRVMKLLYNYLKLRDLFDTKDDAIGLQTKIDDTKEFISETITLLNTIDNYQ